MNRFSSRFLSLIYSFTLVNEKATEMTNTIRQLAGKRKAEGEKETS